ncbi:MAG: right-handed parallel beta-helix repeat-containing protein [Bacteroidota bacterium]
MKSIFKFFLLCISINGYSQPGDYEVDALVTPKRPEAIITVGGDNADVPGFTNKAIQIAISALPAHGGSVKLDPGIFYIKAPVKVPSNVTLIGSGDQTVLKRITGINTNFIVDADYGELKVTVKDVVDFEVGMSIQITDSIYDECWDVSIAVITDIVGNEIYFDTPLIRDYEYKRNGMVTNAGSCISVMGAQNVLIKDLMIDGNKQENDLLDGCNGGGIVIIRSKNIKVNNVKVRNFNGEGITWQITENVSVIGCEVSGCTNMGLHPGSGSPKTQIENNNVFNNKVGLFICWRVHHSLVKNNKFHHNSSFGISTGHKDTDVLFEGNHIYSNGKDGVYFRAEDYKNAPHRNTFVNNVVENNGSDNGGYGFYVSGDLTELKLENNVIRDTGTGSQKAGVFLASGTAPVKQAGNKMNGHSIGNIIHEK